MSQPTTARRGVPSGLGATRAWNLDEQRPCSLHPGEHGGAGCRGVPRRQKQCGRVRDLGEPAPGHFEDADLVGWTETVFYRAEDAEVPAALALERDHRIDHMFDDAGTGDLAVLGDMPDKDHRRAGCLRETDQRLRRAAHLADRAGRRFDKLGPHRLNGIDNDKGRALAMGECRDNILDARLGGEFDRRRRKAKPQGAQADLIDRLLAGNIDDAPALSRQARRRPE